MNYLAHLYLSGEDEKTMVGNFIGDYVKGKAYTKYSSKIQQGILLHRNIDTFTDTHPIFRKTKELFRPEFGLYSGIIVDFIFDHYLASLWNNYSEITLRTFSKRAHAILLINFINLPKRVQGFLPFLIQNRRLESYANVDGIIQSIDIMSRYSSLPAKSEIVKNILLENYNYLSENYTLFMKEIIDYVSIEHKIEIKKPDEFARL